MGIEAIAEGKIKCNHCKKKKFGVFKIVSGRHYCKQCYENLGGKDFKDAMEELE